MRRLLFPGIIGCFLAFFSFFLFTNSAFAAACPITDGGAGDSDGAANGTIVINASASWSPPGTMGDFFDCSAVNITITNNSTLTFNSTPASGLYGYLKVANLTIDSGSSISANAKGCTSALSGTYYGFAPNSSNVCTQGGTGAGVGSPSGSAASGGGGHGGAGGAGQASASYAGGASNDSLTAPVFFGSSGGASSSQVGGAGGGLIRLNVTSILTHNGSFSANGSNGSSTSRGSGGGAGGSIYITAGTIAGSTGTFSALGGNGGAATTYYGGGGGGGRIAVTYTSSSFSFSNSNLIVTGGAAGGGAAVAGTKGTAYVKNTTDSTSAFYGNLTFDASSYASYDFSGESMTFDTSSTQTCLSTATTPSLSAGTLTMGGTLTCTAATGLTSLTLTSTTGALNMASGAVINVNVTGANLNVNLPASTSSTWTDVTITGGAKGFFNIDDAASLTVTGTSSIAANINWTSLVDLNLGSSVTINTNGKGCTSTQTGTYYGFAPNSSNVCTQGGTGAGVGSSSSSAASGGGGHGGAGGAGQASASYAGGASNDSLTAPVFFGSSGGASSSQVGGAGGGLIRLNVTNTLTHNGLLSANGSNGSSTTRGSGGGAGGSIYITAGTIAGSTGTFSALGGNGGAATTYYGGGGGGGRIAVISGLDSSSFLSGLTAASTTPGGAAGGGSAVAGSTGTLYVASASNPALSSAVTGDTDSDGHLDAIVVTLDQDITSDSVAGSDFTVTGYTVASASRTATNTVTVVLTELASFDTSATPQVSVVGSISGAIYGAITSGDVTPADGAGPVGVSASFKDTDFNGTVNRVDVVFSENISATFHSGDWTFPSAGSLNLTDTNATVSTNTLQITVGADAGETSTSSGITVLYTNVANRITDSLGNIAPTFSSAIAMTDGAAPVLKTITTGDANSDGLLDALTLTWTENIDTDDGSAPVLADFGTITFPGPVSITSATISDPAGASAVITLTDMVGQTSINTATTSVGINGITTQWTDGTNVTSNPDDSESVVDGAAPVIRTDGINTPRYEDNDSDGTIDRIKLVFSESTILSSYTDADWVITENNLTSFDVTGISTTGSATVYLTATAASNLTGVTSGSTQPTLAYTRSAGSVRDSSSNEMVNVSGLSFVDALSARLRTDGSNAPRYEDANTDGVIDRVRLMFTEAVTVTYADNNWIIVENALTGFDVGALSSGNGTSTIYLTATTSANVTGIGSGTAPTIRFAAGSGGSIVDGAGAALASFSATSVTDGANPLWVSQSYRDINYNGTVDRFDISFTEPLTVNECEAGDYTIGGVDAGSIAVTACAISGNDLQLTVSGAPAGDTSLALTLAYTSTNGIASSLRDSGSNAVSSWSAASLSDATAPYPITYVYKDINSNGTIDRVDITFSEAMQLNSCEAGDYVFTGADAGSIAVASCAVSGNDVQLTITGAPSYDTNLALVLAYSQTAGTDNSLSDAGGNNIPDLSSLTLTDAALPILRTDSTNAPRYEDNDANGTVDRVRLLFTENVTLTYADADWAATANTLTSFDVTAYSSGNGSSTIYLSATAQASLTGVGGGTQPTLAFTAGSGSITDGTNTVTSISAASLIDGAAPYVRTDGGNAPKYSSTNGNVTSVTLVFTEAVTLSYADADWTATANNLTSFDVTGYSSGNSTSTLVLATTAQADRVGVAGGVEPTLAFTAGSGSLSDASSNALASFSATSLTDNAFIAALSGAYKDSNGDGTVDRIDITLSQAVTVSACEAGDYTIGGADAGSITVASCAVSGDDLRLTLSGVTSYDTDLALTLAYSASAGTADSLLGAVTIEAVPSFSAITLTDSAFPILRTDSTNAPRYEDNNADGTVDRVRLLFTENVTLTYADADWTATANNLTSFDVTAYSSGNGSSTIYLSATAQTNLTGVGGGTQPTLAFTAGSGSISDGTNAVTSISATSLNDLVRPRIVSLSPVHGATNVSPTADVVATFSEPVVTGSTSYTFSTNPSGITDTWSVGNTVLTISHSGSWTSSASIIFTVTAAPDASGNTLNGAIAGVTHPATFTIAAEVINPELTGATTQDNDGDGQIDRIVITFDQDITGDSVTGSDFSVTGYTISSASRTASGEVTIVLTEGGTPDTDATPTVSVVGSVSGASSGAVTSGSEVAVDGAAPARLSGAYKDVDANGTVDRFDVTFSEPVSVDECESGDYTIGGADAGSIAVASCAVSGDDLRLTLGGVTVGDTSLSLTFAYTAANGVADSLHDAVGNAVVNIGTSSLTDAAVPLIKTLTIEDTNADALIDKITIAWTENIDTDDGSAPVLADLGTITLPDSQTVSSATISDPAGGSASVVLTNIVGQVTKNTAVGSTAINGITTQWTDGTNATSNPDDAESIVDAALPLLRTDSTNAPRYEDNNADGTIDRVRLLFTETVTFSYADADWTATANDLTSFDVTAYSSGNGSSTIYLSATAQTSLTGVGGGTQPTLAFTAGSGSISDGTNTVPSISSASLNDFARSRIVSLSPVHGATGVSPTADVVATFSEPIVTGSAGYSFSTNPSGITDTWSVGDTVLTITHSGSWSSSAVITFTVTAAPDASGNALNGAIAGVTHPATFTMTAEVIDPELTGASTQDNDVDGQIDRIVITFDQDITSGSVAGSDFLVTGYTISSASRTAGGEVTIVLAESGTPDTDATPTVSVVGSVSGASSGAATSGSEMAVDGAVPVPLSGAYYDSNGNGTVETVRVTFSEPLVYSACQNGDFSFSGADAGDFAVTSCVSGGGDVGVFTVTTTTGALDTALNLTFAYNASAGAADSLYDSHAIPLASFSGFVLTDEAVPARLSAAYEDVNHDGTIDRVRLVFTENVTLTYADADWITDPNDLTSFEITDYSSGNGTSTLYLNANAQAGKTGVSGGDEPTLAFSAVTGSLQDSEGDVIASLTAITVSDLANPVMLAGEYRDVNTDGRVESIDVTMSEETRVITCESEDYAFSGSSATGILFSACPSDDFTIGRFTISGAPVLATALTLGFGYAQDGGVDNSLQDAVGNAVPSVALSSLNDAAAPLIRTDSTNAPRYEDNNTDGTIDRVRLLFTEAVTVTYSDSDWTTTANGLTSFDVTGYASGNSSSTLYLSATAQTHLTGVGSGTQAQLAYTAGSGGVRDAANNSGLALSARNLLDVARPAVWGITPAYDAQNISRSLYAVLYFTEPMSSADTDVALTPEPTGLTGSWSENNTVYTLTSTTPLAGSREYAIVLTGGNDYAGNVVIDTFIGEDGVFPWVFTTQRMGGGSSLPQEVKKTLEILVAQEDRVREPLTSIDAQLPITLSWKIAGVTSAFVDIFYSIDGGDKILVEENYTPVFRRIALPGTITGKKISFYLRVHDLQQTILSKEAGPYFIGSQEVGEEETTEDSSSYSLLRYVKAPEFPTVYAVDSEGKRRPFLSSDIFFTYAETYAEISEVSLEELQKYPLGKPVLPNPGQVLVKIMSDPKVYYIDTPEIPGGSPRLRHVADEEMAIELFGAGWSDAVLDIEPTFFARFVLGAPMTLADTPRTLQTRNDLFEKRAR